MLNWIFKKKPAPGTAAPAPAKAPPPPAPPPGPSPAQAAAERLARDADWSARLHQATGDDAALLALARQAPSAELKLAAVEALSGEAALKEAEREFRTHDRRVHRAAKQRLAAAVARRTTHEAADRLIDAAQALLDEPVIAANRLVALDRDWQALDQDALAGERTARFTGLTERLSALTHERAEHAAAVSRWTAAAADALAALKDVTLKVAEGHAHRDLLTAASGAAAAVLAGVPPGVDTAEPGDALQAARLTAAQVDARLDVLALAMAPAAVSDPATASEPASSPEDGIPDAPADALPTPAERWSALPPVADAAVARVLAQRWQAATRPAPAPRAPAQTQAARPARAPRAAPADPDVQARVDAALASAETALAEGHLADAHRLLTSVEEHASTVQRGRAQALWAEHARLKGWQQWGGARARDDLVAEAEALAAITAAPDARIATRELADTIDAQRKRWKELDRLGGPANQALWQRFDAALKAAYVPVAAHLARLDAERQANLEARQALLATLEATPPAADTGWREQVRALDVFQGAWRKLGPIEHTVPHKAREALVARWKDAIARIEGPLADARRDAQRERETLVARAVSLGTEAAGPRGRDTVARVRELQAEWQEHARHVPLARPVENALWASFKAATDAVFAQRDAVFQARDDELRGHQAAREALIARLEAVPADVPAHDAKRTLAEVDQQWRQAGDAPRQEAARLDARYRAAREAVQQHLADAAKRQWQDTVDALLARHAACERREQHGADAALDAEWAALPAVPAAWARALDARWTRGAAPAADAATTDRLLLQAEMALDIASPEAFQAARREMKLQAMKAALESRQAPVAAAVGLEEAVAQLLTAGPLDGAQRARFDAVIAALRSRPRS